MVIRIVITTAESHSLSNLNLYVAAAEDTVFYNAPNGEKEHYNVFRKELINQNIVLPSTVGDSIIFTARTANHVDWDPSRMFAIAMVEHTGNKAIEQVERSKGDKNTTVLNTANVSKSSLLLYPNPANSSLFVKGISNVKSFYQIIGLQGQMIAQGNLIDNRVDISGLKPGTYTLELINNEGTYAHRFIKLNN